MHRIYRYFVARNPQAAFQVTDALFAAGDSLDQNPRRFRRVKDRDDLREMVAEADYIIRYLIKPDEVVILRVRHGARRPMP